MKAVHEQAQREKAEREQAEAKGKSDEKGKQQAQNGEAKGKQADAEDKRDGKAGDDTPARKDEPRTLSDLPGNAFPPAGQCRVWYPDRAPGKQPKAAPCKNIKNVPAGAFLLYDKRVWDADYDWSAARQRDPKSVPQVVVDALKKDKR